MRDPVRWAAFRTALRRRGMPEAYAARCERELTEHLEDLRAEAIADGMSVPRADQHATEVIGDLNRLANNLSAAMKQGTWWGRHPIIGFAVLPVVCFTSALLALLFLGAILGHFAGWWGARETLGDTGREWLVAAVRTAYYGLLFAIPLGFGLLAHRCGCDVRTALWTTGALMLHGLGHQLVFGYSASGHPVGLRWAYAWHWDAVAVLLPWIGFGVVWLFSRPTLSRLGGVAALGLVLGGQTGRAAETLPEPAEVTAKLLARARSIARTVASPKYCYQKRSLVEELNGAGQVVKSTEKLFDVTLIAGVPFSRLVKIQGRQLTSEELKKEDAREEAFRQKLTSVNLKRMARNKETWLTPALLDKFQFTVEERLAYQGRKTLRLKFQPKPGGAPEKSIQDRVLNRLAGTIWLDEADSEIVKGSVHLSESVNVGMLGIIGSLSQVELTLDRERLADGVWVNRKHLILIQGRKLFTSMRYRTTEESSGFHKAESVKS